MINPVKKAHPDAGGVVGEDREQEFERLFERYSQPVTYFFARRGFTPEECSDLTQETFLGVYKGMDRFRHDAKVETWLFTIAANIWRNELRSRSAEKREGQLVPLDAEREDSAPGPVEVVAEGDGPLEGLLSREDLRRVREGLEKLPPQMRRCLVLRIDGELKYREIADLLGISIETVKSQIFQARKRLEELLRDD
jgi:RNA polymerase sigma-70 factor (ECF subfamily)